MRIPDIIALCAREFEVSPEDVTGVGRTRWAADARHAAMSLCRRYKRMSFCAIGRVFKKDHTTVMWACRKAKDCSDPLFRERMSRIEAAMGERPAGIDVFVVTGHGAPRVFAVEDDAFGSRAKGEIVWTVGVQA